MRGRSALKQARREATGMTSWLRAPTRPWRETLDRPKANRDGVNVAGAGRGHDARLMAKLFRYSAGLAGSKVLPITTKVLLVAAGGVRPISFISLAVSVARKTFLATPA